MYSETDLRSAVEAGAISNEAARALRSHVASMKDAVPADAEHFRLITGFNDIFVSIGVVIMLLAAVGIGQAIGGAYDEGTIVRDGLQMLFGGALAAGTAWLLAEFFTRKRRMALPSIILLLAFVLGVAGATLGAAVAAIGPGDGTPDWIGGHCDRRCRVAALETVHGPDHDRRTGCGARTDRDQPDHRRSAAE